MVRDNFLPRYLVEEMRNFSLWDPRVEFKYGIGGEDKMNSSSWILHDYFERQRKLLGI